MKKYRFNWICGCEADVYSDCSKCGEEEDTNGLYYKISEIKEEVLPLLEDYRKLRESVFGNGNHSHLNPDYNLKLNKAISGLKQ